MLVLKIISIALKSIYDHKLTLVKALLLPFLAILSISLFGSEIDYFSGKDINATTGMEVLSEYWPIFLVSFLVQIVFYTLIAITVHRVVLMGKSSVPEWGIIKPTKRELLFFVHLIGIYLIVGISSMTIPLLGFLIGFYLLSRLSLIFPAIATDQNWSFSDSWRATQKHQLLMFFVVVIFPILTGIIEAILSSFNYHYILAEVLGIIELILIIATLSIAFKVLTDEKEKN